MTRSRSEYRDRAQSHGRPRLPPELDTRPPSACDPDALAALLLDAYRGTVDDEGESEADARAAIDYYLGELDDQHSFVLLEDGAPVCMAFVVKIGNRRYIDPVATASDHKQRGLGRTAVALALASLASGGESTAGAVITDDNLASRQLFTSLGFRRTGPWPPPTA